MHENNELDRWHLKRYQPKQTSTGHKIGHGTLILPVTAVERSGLDKGIKWTYQSLLLSDRSSRAEEDSV